MTIEIFEPAPIYQVQNTGPYAVPHPYEAGALRVSLGIGGVVTSLDAADYQVSPLRSTVGGTVTLTAAVVAANPGATLIITRDTPEEQGWASVLGEREKGLEVQLDRIVMVQQELRQMGLSSIRSIEPMDPIVPADGRALIWDGNQLVPGPNAEDIARGQEYADRAEAAWASTAATAQYTTPSFSALRSSVAHYPAGAQILPRAESGGFEVLAPGSPDATFVTPGGIYMRPSVRSPRVTPRMFGAIANGTADDAAAIQACWIWGASYRIPVDMEGLSYACSSEVTTRSNLTVYGRGAVMYLTAYPGTGGFVHNVVPGDPLARIQSNIRIYDLITDGSRLPAPNSTQNTNLGPEFGWGASDVQVVNCTARYIRRGNGGGTGGAGLGGEQGLRDVHFIGCNVYRCYRGVRVAGIPGTQAPPNSQSRRAIGLVFRDITIRECDAAILCHSIGHGGDDSSDLTTFDALFDGVYIEDCGHAAWSAIDFAIYSTIRPQKSGVIVFAGAQNIRMRGVRVRINADYTSRPDWLGRAGYPAAGTNYIGAGQSGRVGALVWGWGRNVVIEDITLDGSVDCARRIARCPALGEIASIPAGRVDAPNMQNNMNIVHVQGGAMASVVDGWRTDGGVGLEAAYTTEIVTFSTYAAPTGGVVSAAAIPSGGFTDVTGLHVEFRTFRGTVVAGSADRWLADPEMAGFSDFVRKGGIDLGGGYSSTGAKKGASYDASAGVLRLSQDTSDSMAVMGFYNTSHGVGSVTTNGTATAYNTSSDERLKEDPQPFDGLEIINRLRMYDFAWRRDGSRDKGGYAQEIAQVYPRAVTHLTDDSWGVDYSKLVPVLISSAQQLDARLLALEATIARINEKE